MTKFMYDNLSKRERQIMDIVIELKRASAQAVRDRLRDAPSYSAVRALLAIMVRKGYLLNFQEGRKYVYVPALKEDRLKRKALENIVRTFFNGSVPAAIRSILAMSTGDLSPAEAKEIKNMIEQAKKAESS